MTDKKIGIAGCGGIGSNVAMHLARSGVKRLKIVDFDRVDATNLNRQFYFSTQLGMVKVDTLERNLKDISPDIYIEKENKKLTAENLFDTFKDCDVVVEGFDKAADKAVFLENFLESGKFIVSANGVAGNDLDGVTVRKLNERAYVVGDFTSDIADFKLYSTKVIVIASVMANLVLKELGCEDK
jgi:sulfur carrier protein ThiS adenylyltransferase